MDITKLYNEIIRLDASDREALFKWVSASIIADNKADELITWITTMLADKTIAQNKKLDLVSNAVYDAVSLIPDAKFNNKKVPEWRIVKAIYSQYGGTGKLNKLYNGLKTYLINLKKNDIKGYDRFCEVTGEREFFEKIINSKGE